MLKNAIYNFKEIHTETAGIQRYKSWDHCVASGEKTVYWHHLEIAVKI